jgi:GAF domain-containing protein
MDRRASRLLIWSLVAVFALLQAITWSVSGGIPRRPGAVVQIVAAWIVMLLLASLASRRVGSLSDRLTEREQAHRLTLGEIEQLETQALAGRIARIVPCDRVGLTLLKENNQEFQTYTARVHEEERRSRPRPEVSFKVESTAIGFVVRSREPLVLNDMEKAAPEFLDANVLHSAGFRSSLMMPLVSKGRAVGTLNVVSRKRDSFHEGHVEALRPIAELFAVAQVAQALQMLLGKHQTMELMAELTLSIASDINSALQTIMGHCDLIARGYPDADLHRDLATITRQAQRIAVLLEKMRAAAEDRMNEVTQSMHETGIPASPEADREIT